MASNIEDALIKDESIQVNQGILGRIFNYGSLIISVAGDPQAPVPGISDPMSFAGCSWEPRTRLRKQEPHRPRPSR